MTVKRSSNSGVVWIMKERRLMEGIYHETGAVSI